MRRIRANKGWCHGRAAAARPCRAVIEHRCVREIRTGDARCIDRATLMARGFTLIEVLIAIALLIAVVGTSFTFMNNLLNSRQRLMDEAARQRSTTILIDRLEASLLTCIAGDSAHGAGIAGDDRSIAILTRGVAAHLAETGLRDPRVLGDLQRVEFRFVESSQSIEARSTAVSIARPSDTERGERADDEEGGVEEEPFWTLGSAAVVRFRFHDGSRWVDSYDSIQAGHLPSAVEVAIWFTPWPGANGLEGNSATDPESEDSDEETGDDESDRVFDEDAFALRSEMELYYSVPAPDRVRVIAIPDPDQDDAESVEFADEEGEVQ